ncbi:MAG: ArnT family glycosyltransferase [Ktedonobacteraceae bacterium]
MSNTYFDTTQATQELYPDRNAFLSKIGSWMSAWEILPILGIAAFLRFYQLTTTEFDADQAMIFRLARDAISHGLIPATSNIASIRIVNPPAVIYLLMIPAAISSNPIGGAIFVGLLNIIAVLLTYIFVRHYYGRLASIIASLLYATASEPLHYSRFIWQHNMIAPFMVLFMFALYWGVVDRRKGWLFPALILLGILIQLHETTIVLFLLLLVALALSPGTVRLRDLILGFIFLLLLFSTYILWESSIKFADLNLLLQMLKLHAHFDLTALKDYMLFLYPYSNPPTNVHTLEYKFIPLLGWLIPIMAIFMVFGFVSIIIGVISSSHSPNIADVEVSRGSRNPVRRILQAMGAVWADFRATPQRCGYFLLLCWQIVPILILSRHAAPIFPYYLLMVLPGPFIIIGILFSTIACWIQHRGGMWSIAYYGVFVVTCLVIVAQILGSVAGLVDEASGNNLHGYSYNALSSLDEALKETDQLAIQHNLNQVYIATDQYTQTSLEYLSEQMHTPATLFDASCCLVLPNATTGPAALLIGPYDTLSLALLSHFARATLVSKPERLGGAPFQLYLVQPLAVSTSTPSPEAFVYHLQLLDAQVQKFRFDDMSWYATRWSYLRSAVPAYRTTYTYSMKALFHGKTAISSQCTSTPIRAGDQLIVTFPLTQSSNPPSSMTISANSFTEYEV